MQPAEPVPFLVEERTVHVRFGGRSHVVAVREARGWPTALLSASDAEAYAMDVLGADELVASEVTLDGARTTMRVEATGCDAVDPFEGHGDTLPVRLDAALDLLAPRDLAPGPLPPSRRALIVRYLLPPGVGPARVPEDERRAIGPIRWTVTWTDRPGELAVHAVCEVAAGPLDRLALRKVRIWADRVGAGTDLTLHARALRRADSDPAAAARELDGLVSEHPHEAAYHGFRALLRARCGLRAAALAGLDQADIPDAARQYWRGRVLLYDPLGRERTLGADRDGAVAAFGAAAAQGYGEARYYYAGALTLGARGFPFGPGARLDAAVAELLRLGWSIGPMELDLLEALVRLGRHAEAVARVEQDAPHLDSEGSFFAAIALSRGVEAAVAAAEARFPSPKERLRACAKASLIGFLTREYDIAGALLDAGADATGTPRESLRAVYGRPVARAALQLPEGHPALLLGDLLQAWLAADESSLARLVSTHAGSVAALFDPLRREAAEKGPTLVVDLAYGGTEVLEIVPGVGAVVRARLLLTEFDAWLTWEGGGWRYLGCDATAGALAAEALRHLDAGDLAAGATWVRWLVDAHEGVGWTRHGRRPRPLVERVLRPDPAADVAGVEPSTTAGLLWRAMNPDDPAHLRAVAGTLAVDATRPLPDLAGLPPDLETLALEHLEENLLLLGRPHDALVVIDRLLALTPPTLSRRALRARARLATGDEAGALADLHALRDEAPDDLDVQLRLLHAFARLGRPEALEVARSIGDLPGDVSVSAVNNLAWWLLFGDDTDIARAVALSDAAWDPADPHAALANTRAVARVLQGDIGGALAVWREAVAPGEDRYPLPDWRYVEGRIAEALALPDAARAAYARIPEPVEGGITSRRYSARALADARVASLG